MKRLSIVPIITAILLLATAFVTVTGCKKGKMEPAPEIKLYPKLNPEGSIIGTWEWGFSTSSAYVDERIVIPAAEKRFEQFTIYPDSSWEYRSNKVSAKGKKIKWGHGEHRYDKNAQEPDFTYDSILFHSDGFQLVLRYTLRDTCLVHTNTYIGYCGSASTVYYLRKRIGDR